MKTPVFFRRSFFICSVCLILTDVLATDIILIRKDDDPKPPLGWVVNQMNILSTPETTNIEATVENNWLTVSFEQSTEMITISILDSNQTMVYQTIVDSSIQSSETINISTLATGSYTLNIEYDNTQFYGEFDIE